jgi:signal transduction histidine kinase
MSVLGQGFSSGWIAGERAPSNDSSERIIAVARLAFAALALATISLGMDGQGAASSLVVGYIVAALILLPMPWVLRARPLLWVGTIVDLTAVAAMLWTSDGLNGLFFITLTYALLAATLRWNWRGTAAAAGVLVIFLVGGMVGSTLMERSAASLATEASVASLEPDLPDAPGAPLTTASLDDNGGVFVVNDIVVRFGMVFIAALMLGYLGMTRERAELSNAELQTELRDSLEQVRTSQGDVVRARRQIARDVHDGILQDLAAANLLLSSVATAMPENIRSDVAEVSKLLTGQQRRLRVIVDAINSKPSHGALSNEVSELGEALTAKWKRMVRVCVDPPDLALPDRLRSDVVYFLGEATANAVRHGGASAIDLSLRLSDDHHVIVACEDNGQTPSQPGELSAAVFVPHSLNERVVDAGGRLAAVRSPFGASVRAEFPLS